MIHCDTLSYFNSGIGRSVRCVQKIIRLIVEYLPNRSHPEKLYINWHVLLKDQEGHPFSYSNDWICVNIFKDILTAIAES